MKYYESFFGRGTKKSTKSTTVAVKTPPQPQQQPTVPPSTTTSNTPSVTPTKTEPTQNKNNEPTQNKRQEQYEHEYEEEQVSIREPEDNVLDTINETEEEEDGKDLMLEPEERDPSPEESAVATTSFSQVVQAVTDSIVRPSKEEDGDEVATETLNNKTVHRRAHSSSNWQDYSLELMARRQALQEGMLHDREELKRLKECQVHYKRQLFAHAKALQTVRQSLQKLDQQEFHLVQQRTALLKQLLVEKYQTENQAQQQTPPPTTNARTMMGTLLMGLGQRSTLPPSPPSTAPIVTLNETSRSTTSRRSSQSKWTRIDIPTIDESVLVELQEEQESSSSSSSPSSMWPSQFLASSCDPLMTDSLHLCGNSTDVSTP